MSNTILYIAIGAVVFGIIVLIIIIFRIGKPMSDTEVYDNLKNSGSSIAESFKQKSGGQTNEK